MASCCEHGSEPSGFICGRKFSYVSLWTWRKLTLDKQIYTNRVCYITFSEYYRSLTVSVTNALLFLFSSHTVCLFGLEYSKCQRRRWHSAVWGRLQRLMEMVVLSAEQPLLGVRLPRRSFVLRPLDCDILRSRASASRCNSIRFTDLHATTRHENEFPITRLWDCMYVLICKQLRS